jgi:hypothetical protein
MMQPLQSTKCSSTAARFQAAQIRIITLYTAILLLTCSATFAQDANQQQAPASSVNSAQSAAPVDEITVPAGTKIALGLVRALSVKHAKAGDDVNLQITFPVTADNQMVIPPGTYVTGPIEKILERDKSRALLRFQMRFASLIFATGYVATISGPVTVDSYIAELTVPNLPSGMPVPVLAAANGPTPPPLPPLPPLPGSGARTAIIGLGVAGAVGAVIAGVVFAHHSDVFMEAGTPMEIYLPAPLTLNRTRIMAAVQQYTTQAASAPPEIVKPPKKLKTCWTAGTPGTPDTVIPGTPPTVIPGDPPTVIPGTPPTVIPGTPGTEPTSYPCPR